MFRQTEWSYLVNHKPEDARARILAAYAKTKGNATRAAAELEISHAHLLRIVGRLKLDADIAALRLNLRVS